MIRVGATIVPSPLVNIWGWQYNHQPNYVRVWKTVIMNKDPDKDIIMKLSALLPPPASSIRSVHCAGCGVKNGATEILRQMRKSFVGSLH